MTSEFWGMTAFLITTLVFLGTTLFFRLRLDRAQRQLDQVQQKSTQSKHPDSGRKTKQVGTTICAFTFILYVNGYE